MKLTYDEESILWRLAILAVTLGGLLWLGVRASAEDFQCHECCCFATISTGGVQRDVRFRRGDVISTDSGWVLFPDNGWVELRSRKINGDTMDVWMLTADEAHARIYSRDSTIPFGWVASDAYYGLDSADGWGALTMAGEPAPREMCLVGVRP